MIPTPEQAWDLLCEFNEGDFHRKHARTVGDVLRGSPRTRAMARTRISGSP